MSRQLSESVRFSSNQQQFSLWLGFRGLFACGCRLVDGWIRGVVSPKYWHRLSHEQDLWRQGLSLVAGVDEAGCGPVAGPVVAAAVMFPSEWLESGLCRKLRGLNDSKLLTEGDREKYYAVLTSLPEVHYAIASKDVETIDRINIRQAAWRAMEAALNMLQPRPQHVLVDGLKIRWLNYPQTALVDGDARSYTIAAASVLAKVTRDRIMREFEKAYPGYGFGAHKGYCTPQHLEAIKALGPCPIHRRSFWPFRPVETPLELFPELEGPDGKPLSLAPCPSREPEVPASDPIAPKQQPQQLNLNKICCALSW